MVKEKKRMKKRGSYYFIMWTNVEGKLLHQEENISNVIN